MLTLEQNQLARLNQLLAQVSELNPFYSRKWRLAGVSSAALKSLDELGKFPLTTRAELLADQLAVPPLGTNLACAPRDVKRIHRSSGTTRAPILWADTKESWESVRSGSEKLFRLADVTPSDRLLFIMPFEDFSGPWIIYEGACQLGCACFTAGNAEAAEQLRWLKTVGPSVLVGKPSRLAAFVATAEAASVSPQGTGVRKLILTAEPSSHLRTQLERQWNARCFNRYGMTEAGSIAGECGAHSSGMHLLDEEYVAEVIDPITREPLPDGEPGELVLTNLGRWPRPIVRYRTGDHVRFIRHFECPCGRSGTFLQGDVTRQPIQ
jgi:phenylacetate-CoA ligase